MALDMETGVAVFTLWGMRILSAVMILVAGWLIGNYGRKAIMSIKKLDETLKFFLGGLFKYAVFVVAIITILGQFGVQTASLIAVLGAAGLAIGLALQGTLSNVAAGTMLLILRPFKVGDYIETGKVAGTVKELGLFGTELATAENIFIFVPNSQIWNSEIKNYNHNTQRRQDILFSISYEENIDKTFKTIQKILEKDERLVTSKGKEPQIVINTLGASSVDVLIRVWTTTGDYWTVKWDLTKAIKESLEDAGISIPATTRTIIAMPDKTQDNKAA